VANKLDLPSWPDDVCVVAASPSNRHVFV
jgi:hypothetical protein